MGQWLLALSLLLSPGLGLLLYCLLLQAGSPRVAWRLGRLVLLVSAASLLAAALGLGGVEALSSLAPVLPALVFVQGVVGHFFDRRVVGVVDYRFPDGRYRVKLIDDSGVAAFTLAVSGRVYASTQLFSRLDPMETAAVVAHEIGHRRSLSPLPAPLAVGLLVALLAWAVEGVAEALLEAHYPEAAAGMVAVASSWILFSWAWEHLADIYSLQATGLYAVSALQRITGALPERPLKTRLLRSLAQSLRPHRAGALLVNPHPSPGLRLWLLLRLAENSTTPGLLRPTPPNPLQQDNTTTTGSQPWRPHH